MSLAPVTGLDSKTIALASSPLAGSNITTVSLTLITFSVPAGIVNLVGLTEPAGATPIAAITILSYAMCNLFCSDQIT